MSANAQQEQEQYLRTEFLERIAHELRGPASVIQNVLHEVSSALGGDAEKHAHMLAIAQRSVRRILRQADRLQQTGQLERGEVPIAAAPCDLAELVQTTARATHALERRRGIDIDVETPTEPADAVLDARWVVVAIQELTSNALRHARARVSVRLLDDGDRLVLLVRDDNPNPRPFGPSRFRATRERRGLGLSLSIIDEIATAHGGTLEISTDARTDEPGAEVRLCLPRRPVIPSGDGARTEERPDRAPGTR